MTTSAEIRQQLGAALDFQGQLQAYGAITGRRKLPWRYRWPDAVRDDVLARLLALNAERYAEDQSQSLMVGPRKKLSGRNKQLSKLDLSAVRESLDNTGGHRPKAEERAPRTHMK